MPRKTRVHPFRVERRSRRRSDSYPEKSTYCVKYTMFFMNVMFWFISCLIILIGAYAMVAKQELYGKISSLTTDPALILVAIGTIMFTISFCGCLGALRENLCLLKFFSVMLGVMLVLEITAAVLGYVYYGRVKEEVNDAFNTMIVRYRDDPDLQLVIDTLQKELKCCGTLSYNDWQKNEYFNCSSPSVEKCGVPYSCCLSDQINSQCGFGVLRGDKEEAAKVIHTQGCLPAAEAWLKGNLILMASIAASFPLLQLFGFALARRLSGDIRAVLQRMR